MGRNMLVRDDGSAEDLKSKVSFRAHAGDTISILTLGGGGWGEEAPDDRWEEQSDNAAAVSTRPVGQE
jgi:N-methylhydantoinase B/oxoprolinase/acetone carboxylase alpha subunit